MSRRATHSSVQDRFPKNSALGCGDTPSTGLDALLDGRSDHRFRQLVQDFMSFSVGMQTIRERFAKAMGITGGQYSLLVAVPHLESRQVPVTVSSLAKYMHVSGTYVTAECNKLEGAGYLCRHSHPNDRRSMLLSLTDEGRRLIESVLPALRLVNDEIFRGLTRGEFRTLCRLMGGLAVSIGDAVLISESYSRKIERAHNG